MYKVFKLKHNYSYTYGDRLTISNKYSKYVVPFKRDFSKTFIDVIREVARQKLESEGYKIIGFSSDLDTDYSIVICM